MKRYFFTFGSDPGFPYRDTYLVVYAFSLKEAIAKFRKKHPDRHANCLNCAFFYTEEEWEGSENQKFYPVIPAEVIR